MAIEKYCYAEKNTCESLADKEVLVGNTWVPLCKEHIKEINAAFREAALIDSGKTGTLTLDYLPRTRDVQEITS